MVLFEESGSKKREWAREGEGKCQWVAEIDGRVRRQEAGAGKEKERRTTEAAKRLLDKTERRERSGESDEWQRCKGRNDD